jgi:hypothetical protein
MGQLHSSCRAPPRNPGRSGASRNLKKKQTLKPGFHLIGARVETGRLSDTGAYGSGGVSVHRPTGAAAADDAAGEDFLTLLCGGPTM